MKRLRTLAHWLLAPALLVLSAGCGDDEGEAAREAGGADADAVPGGTLVIADGAVGGSPSPFFFGTTAEADLQDIMAVHLLRGVWKDGRLQFQAADENPLAIARSFEFIGDSTVIRFHLRGDMRWSDGEPITARDVKFTYDVTKNPEVGAAHADQAARMDSLVVENDSTLRIHYQERYAGMIRNATLPIAPSHIYQDVPPGELRTHPSFNDPAENNLVVGGPYRITGWNPRQQVVLERNPHFTPAANLDRIVLRAIPDATTRIVEFRTGNADVIRTLSFDQINELRQQMPEVQLERQDKRIYEYIGYNPAEFEAFEDRDIRRALSLAVDVQGLRSALGMEEFTEPAGGPFPPILRDLYDPESMAPHEFDPEQTAQILESKGWVDGDGDGIREKNGQPFRFTLETNGDNQRRVDVMQIVQQQWRQLGIDAQLRQSEFGTLFQRMLAHDFEAVISGWGVDLSGGLAAVWGPDGPANITQYENPEFTEQHELGQAQVSTEAAAPYWKRAGSILAADQPVTFLYFYDAVELLSPRVRGADINSFGLFNNVWEWWIPEHLQRDRGVPAPPSEGEDSV